MDIQQDLFNNSPLDILKEEMRMELKVVRDRSDNVRRGLFARHNEIVKEQQRLKQELEEMKAFVASISMMPLERVG